jgi:phage-related protein
MNEFKVVFYKDKDGTAPVLWWLRNLMKENLKAYTDCFARIELLKRLGHKLRRPHADYIGNDLYELRTKRGKVNYRLLYFFDGQKAIVLVHGFTKEKILPPEDIKRAIQRREIYLANPIKHTYEEE